MAFKNVQKSLTTSLSAVYTAPASTVGIVFSGVIANKSTSANETQVTLTLTQGSTTTTILNNVPILDGGALTIPKIVILSGGILKAKASANSVLDMTLGILQQPA